VSAGLFILIFSFINCVSDVISTQLLQSPLISQCYLLTVHLFSTHLPSRHFLFAVAERNKVSLTYSDKY